MLTTQTGVFFNDQSRITLLLHTGLVIKGYAHQSMDSLIHPHPEWMF